MEKTWSDDYAKRNAILARARAKYIRTGVTNNIGEALKRYLENDADVDEQIPLQITSADGPYFRRILDDHERPGCPKCGEPLFLRVISPCKTCARKTIKKTSWICQKCGHRIYSEKTLEDWLRELPRKPK